MINSKFIVELLEKNIEGEEYEKLLLKQIKYLSICEKEYTGSGYFIYFEFGSEIEKYKLPKEQVNIIYGNSKRLENIQISNVDQNILATITIHFSDDGIMDCIEIFNYLGIYPEDEVIDYKVIKY